MFSNFQPSYFFKPRYLPNVSTGKLVNATRGSTVIYVYVIFNYFENYTLNNYSGCICDIIFALQRINEKPNIIQEYESGKGIPNQIIIGKIEKILGKSFFMIVFYSIRIDANFKIL